MEDSHATCKILIVDDSRIFRSAIEEGLRRENDIEVVGSVWNGIKALEFIKTSPPDLVTLDVQMPEMDGLQTLQAIQEFNASQSAQKQVGVIMLSSHTQKGADITVRALQMGAFDFIPKPEGVNLRENIHNLCQQLAVKIRQYSGKQYPKTAVRKRISIPEPKKKAELFPATGGIEAVLIGVSTGGPKALAEILPSLCEKLETPILVVQHMPATFTESLAKSLNTKCRYTVVEAQHDDPVLARHVYIAPGGRHMTVENLTDDEQPRIQIHDGPPRKGCRPSVDILFESAAETYGKKTIAVVLTGMGSDGTDGASILRKKGARIVAQDEQSSIVWGMPGSIVNGGLADGIFPLKEMPDALAAIIKRQKTKVTG